MQIGPRRQGFAPMALPALAVSMMISFGILPVFA
jgi:hypothetical protein